MNLFKLESFNDGVALYLYQPEGQGEWGRIQYNRITGKALILERAENTTDKHDFNAVRKMEERCKEKTLPFEFTQAWA